MSKDKKRTTYLSASVPETEQKSGSGRSEQVFSGDLQYLREELDRLNEQMIKKNRDDLDAMYNLGWDNFSPEVQEEIQWITQTESGLVSTVEDLAGNVSVLEQTAEALNFAVFDPNGDLSLVSQKADRIDWVVASGGTASTFTLTPHMASLVADEISISGVVTFNDLETSGQSVVNGDNIELKADASGDSVSYLTYTSANGNTFAELHTRDNQTGTTSDRDRYAFVIETPSTVDGDWCAMKFEAGDSMSLEAGYLLYMRATAQIILTGLAEPTCITTPGPYNPSSTYCQAADTYYFSSDGIYFNGTKILST